MITISLSIFLYIFYAFLALAAFFLLLNIRLLMVTGSLTWLAQFVLLGFLALIVLVLYIAWNLLAPIDFTQTITLLKNISWSMFVAP